MLSTCHLQECANISMQVTQFVFFLAYSHRSTCIFVREVANEVMQYYCMEPLLRKICWNTICYSSIYHFCKFKCLKKKKYKHTYTQDANGCIRFTLLFSSPGFSVPITSICTMINVITDKSVLLHCRNVLLPQGHTTNAWMK